MKQEKLEKYSERFDNDKSEIGNPETWGKRIIEEPKQETLEEAATKEGLFRASQHNFNQAEAGYNAKWFKRGALFGAKWQQERMYDKEKVDKLLDTLIQYNRCSVAGDELIEQFKNK